MLGDIIGEPGRKALAQHLRNLVREREIDLVIGNGENAAGGFGITPKVAEELFDTGIGVITLGNHAWDKKEAVEYIAREPRVIRPANYPEGVPGSGGTVVEVGGYAVGVIQVMGRVHMPTLDCPFRAARREVARLRPRVQALMVDCHAEVTSEKMAMGWYLDGQVSAVVGTHTHVQTADERILPKGTAYLTDLGMTGPIDSVIGVQKEAAIERFLTQMPRRLEPASGPVVISGAVIEVDPSTGRATKIERLQFMAA